MRQTVCPVSFQNEALIRKGFTFLVFLKLSDCKGLKALIRKRKQCHLTVETVGFLIIKAEQTDILYFKVWRRVVLCEELLTLIKYC